MKIPSLVPITKNDKNTNYIGILVLRIVTFDWGFVTKKIFTSIKFITLGEEVEKVGDNINK